jgi:hypothetical protein
MSKNFDSRTYNISEISKWYDENELNISPKFQRNSVWNEQAKSYLIDTIIRDLPIPPIFIRQSIDIKLNKVYREIIDGQQRLRTIIDFINDKFKLHGISSDLNVRGNFFSDLDDEMKENLLGYEISAQIIKEKDDAKIYDMFARLNTNNYVLNKQEIRNAKYWGVFKEFIYEIGRVIRRDFIDWNLFSDRDFSRMRDYELLNSLIIYLIDGIKDETPRIVDSYYEKYDNVFDEVVKYNDEFFKNVDIIRLIQSKYSLSVFNRPRYFYTLFVCIDIARKKGIIDTELLIQRISSLELQLGKSDEELQEKSLFRIKELHFIRTTNSKERKERVDLTYGYLFS